MASKPELRAWRWVLGLAIAQAALYAVIARLSGEFVYGEGFQERPILSVLALFTACFVLYVASLYLALRMQPSPKLGWLIVVSAVLFRGILLGSQPIQEVDIYRYLWDGAVATHGVSPFRFAPAEVLSAARHERRSDGEPPNALQQLVELRNAAPAIAEILRRVHYAELVTIYPPVSQAVFALAESLTPAAATVLMHVAVMKAVILLFDLATIGLIWLLLAATRRHRAWVITYAWCPLVMKEFANSGHLDSIAVFLTTAAIWCCVRLFFDRRRRPLWWWIAAVLLGLAIGAKLYPIVLLPLMTVVIARRSGARTSVTFALTALIVSAATLMPMIVANRGDFADAVARVDEPLPLPDDPPDPASSSKPLTQPKPPSGLTAFLSRWEMNDFLFLFVVENLRPNDAKPDEPEAWFAVVPEACRKAMVTPVVAALSSDSNRAAFLLARAITNLLFLGIVAWLLSVVMRDDSVKVFLEAAFLTLAWFWLHSPTQNPWYWCWALPLLPFARGRAWMAISGLAFAYYLRFWLLYHWADQPVLGTPYDGTLFFDFVVTWLEFGPWFIWLAAAPMARNLKA